MKRVTATPLHTPTTTFLFEAARENYKKICLFKKHGIFEWKYCE